MCPDFSISPIIFTSRTETVPVPGGPPTGAVANTSTADFLLLTLNLRPFSATFIAASLTGNITAWNGTALRGDDGTPVLVRVIVSKPGSQYTGLAIGQATGGNRLYAADFANNHIDIFGRTFAATTVPGGFVDATVPAGYAPYNIQAFGTGLSASIYVTYAKVSTGGHVANGTGLGLVRKFDTDGVVQPGFFINDIGTNSNSRLDAPWGLAIAPASFGAFSNKLLVGNFSANGQIHAYDPDTGAPFVPAGLPDNTLRDESGHNLSIPELRALRFGNGTGGGDVNTLYFTSGLGEEEHGLFGKLNPTQAQAASLIQFATSNFAVDEAGGHVDFTVVRTGDTSGAATVNYNTFDESPAGHASQKSDYEISLGRLTFNPGETSKTFRILIVDDKFVEGDETISLALSNPSGAGVGLGSPNTAEVTILDNDMTPPTTNPVDDASFFVRQHYLDFLNREPDAAGQQFWTNEIESCGGDAQCREVKRINVSAAFFLSIEFQKTGVLAYLANKAAFGTHVPGDTAFPGLPVLYGQFMGDVRQLQRNLIFGRPDFDAQLDANKQAYFADFVQRPNFVSRYPASLSPAEFVDALSANMGPFTLNFSERAALVDQLAANNTTAGRAAVVRAVAENTTFQQREFDPAFVLMEYFGYLRRGPDIGGYGFWLSKLDQLKGDFVQAEMVRAFTTSDEYRKRFGAN